jgi:hypothetical protein
VCCCWSCHWQAYQDLLVGAVSGLKGHLEAPGNALVVDLVIAQGGVALSPSMEELLKVRHEYRVRVQLPFFGSGCPGIGSVACLAGEACAQHPTVVFA